MRRSLLFLVPVLLTGLLLPGVAGGATTSGSGLDACGLATASAAFCKPLTAAHTNGPANSRAGALNGTLWGTAMNTGAYPGDEIATATGCNGQPVDYPNNIQECNGHLTTTVNDGGSVASLALYPRQPFDFTNGGTVTFNVSNDSGGSHAAWPEFWMSDQPVPDPFTHEGSWISQPVNGFGIRFAGCIQTCPGGNGYHGVDSAVVVQNSVVDDNFNGGQAETNSTGAVAPSPPGEWNHYQININAAGTEIDVYGTDPFPDGAYNPAVDPPLVQLAAITNFGTLGFTRGLVWMEDVHYNGDKFNCPPTCQANHSFTWGDLGFSGPVLPRDLGFDVPNNHAPDTFPGSGDPAFDDAYPDPPNTTLDLTVPGIGQKQITAATGALLVFNYYSQSVQDITGTLGNYSFDVPYGNGGPTFSPRTIAIPIPLSAVTAGNDTLTFTTGNDLFQVANIDLILQGAGGTVSPGSGEAGWG